MKWPYLFGCPLQHSQAHKLAWTGSVQTLLASQLGKAQIASMQAAGMALSTGCIGVCNSGSASLEISGRTGLAPHRCKAPGSLDVLYICAAYRTRQRPSEPLTPLRGMGMSWLSIASCIVCAIALAGYAFFLKLQRSLTGNLGKRRTNPVQGSPGGQVVLHGFFTPVGKLCASASPFTAKVETYLRMRGLPYSTQSSDFSSSPNGRVCPTNTKLS